MQIETSTKWGRVRVEMPDEMTPIQRAEVFEDLAGFERAPKRSVSGKDLDLKEASDG